MQKYAILLLIYIIHPASAMAPEQGALAAIRNLLKRKIEHPNTPIYGKAPLLWTCSYDERIDLSKQLLAAGADVEAKVDCYLQTPLHRTMSNFAVATTKLLLDNNANPNACTNQNETPLHFICSFLADTSDGKRAQKRIEIVRLLLAAGANPNAENHKGFTPLLFSSWW